MTDPRQQERERRAARIYLNGYPVSVLRRRAASRGISKGWKMRKAQLVETLIEAGVRDTRSGALGWLD